MQLSCPLSALMTTVTRASAWRQSPFFCFEDVVTKMAGHLSGGAGPCGVDAVMLKGWLVRHDVASTKLREEMAEWVELLSNISPDYATYRALNHQWWNPGLQATSWRPPTGMPRDLDAPFHGPPTSPSRVD